MNMCAFTGNSVTCSVGTHHPDLKDPFISQSQVVCTVMTWVKTTVVWAPVGPACQPCPAATSYWLVSASPSSPAAELLSEEAAAEVMGARLKPQPHRVVPLMHDCCVWLPFQSGAWLGKPVGSKAWQREEREEEGVGRCLILPLMSPLCFQTLQPFRLYPVLSGIWGRKKGI